MKEFPKNFIWGTSTASHQIEGNTLNDWTIWEKQNAARLAEEKPRYFSGASPIYPQIKDEIVSIENYISNGACNSYNRYKEDIQLIESLGIKAYRFSIEWSRIEPERGQFNEEAIAHYRDQIDTLKQKGIEPFLTTVHRTIPLWFAESGGWVGKTAVRDYAAYVERLAKEFAAEVQYWLPLNEPVLNVGGGYVSGQIPPGRKQILVAFKAYANMIKAHNTANDIIHSYRKDAQVGTAHAAVYAEPENNTWYNRVLVSILHYLANWKFLNGVRNHCDFIGIQYYTRGVLGLHFKGLKPDVQNVPQPGPHSDVTSEIYPEGLYRYMKLVWQRYHKPILITENGIADRNDTYRAQYIKDHLAEVHQAINDGMDVRGYFYWSLLDNYEWDTGFWPNFGLAAVNRKTFERAVRPSAYTYAEIIKQNGI